MSGLTAEGTLNVSATSSEPSVGDFLELMKPRVMSLVVFTSLAGLVAAPGNLHPVLAIIAIICIAVGAGASGALNMWYDADIDAHMARTAARPIPRGRVTADEALAFGSVLSVMSVVTLGVLVNWVAGALLALTIAYYVFFYTMWLKRRTPQNIVIGGAAGSFPPMIGWAAVTGTVTIESVLLFLIIFMWTPPHFWALALYRCRDYERVGVPMLPVVAGADETRRQILLYSLVLTPLAVMPYVIGLGGIVYAVVSVVLGLIFLHLAFKVWQIREGREADHAAKRLFTFSIFYLFILFAVILGENLALKLWV
ncbi:MAG: protoheme IX farnesyltransferase [Hyphomicrobium zavarzinii]|jgi:protoheme IX farnesyltransferase|uniref:heme o synthase n=1 Tax=Hyphomicrobium TaxID=81 RepID=UPI000365E7D8|nr:MULTISPECIES: heme o synthase [Hyphomicrobium]MBL8844139.1 protoheme IX farnesyltransferase [Hyphomicrobium zavarzinii]WBT39441.1 heme o synthase [Hyphomicrobium sp. DMF-1]